MKETASIRKTQLQYKRTASGKKQLESNKRNSFKLKGTGKYDRNSLSMVETASS